MSEKKTIRRHRSTYHNIEYTNALWMFKTTSDPNGVELRAHAVCHEQLPSLSPMVSVSLTMTPEQAREVAEGLLLAADFYDRQTERIAAKRSRP